MSIFRTAEFGQLRTGGHTQLPEREACKTIVGLLGLAADGHEAQLATELEQLIELDQLPDLLVLTALVAPRSGVLPDVLVELPDLAGFDALLRVQA